MGDSQGVIWGRLTEAEGQLAQLQAVVVGMSWELEMLGDIARCQGELLQIQWELIMAIDKEQQRRIQSLERKLDPRGRTFGNPVLIDLDPDEVTLVEEPALVRDLISINDTPDGSDE